MRGRVQLTSMGHGRLPTNDGQRGLPTLSGNLGRAIRCPKADLYASARQV